MLDPTPPPFPAASGGRHPVPAVALDADRAAVRTVVVDGRVLVDESLP